MKPETLAGRKAGEMRTVLDALVQARERSRTMSSHTLDAWFATEIERLRAEDPKLISTVGNAMIAEVSLTYPQVEAIGIDRIDRMASAAIKTLRACGWKPSDG